jgi:hypothetical protein
VNLQTEFNELGVQFIPSASEAGTYLLSSTYNESLTVGMGSTSFFVSPILTIYGRQDAVVQPDEETASTTAPDGPQNAISDPSLVRMVENYLQSVKVTQQEGWRSTPTEMDVTTPRQRKFWAPTAGSIGVHPFHGSRIDVSKHPGLKRLLAKLVELSYGDENDDFGRLKPTTYALFTTTLLLMRVARGLPRGVAFPHGALSTDSVGGVRIEWRNGGRNVRLVVASNPSNPHYIYYEEGEQFDVITPVSITHLRERIKWLLSV